MLHRHYRTAVAAHAQRSAHEPPLDEQCAVPAAGRNESSVPTGTPQDAPPVLETERGVWDVCALETLSQWPWLLNECDRDIGPKPTQPLRERDAECLRPANAAVPEHQSQAALGWRFRPPTRSYMSVHPDSRSIPAARC